MSAKLLVSHSSPYLSSAIRCFSPSSAHLEKHSCKLLVVGGGTGGCTISAKLSRHMKDNEIIIVEPSDTHYYQAMFTMIGAGVKQLKDAKSKMKDVLPKSAKWIQSQVVEFNPKSNSVTLANQDTVSYDVMLVAMGLQLYFDQIPGLLEALDTPDSGVCTNYSEKYVNRTYECLQKFQSGNAVFTYPIGAVKCAGAAQKICYLSDHYFRRKRKRDKAKIIYNTALPVIYAIKRYADALWGVVLRRNIRVNLHTNLIAIEPKEKVATFLDMDNPSHKITYEYSMLHVTPPMGPPDILMKSTELVNEAGYVDVDKHTLQHWWYCNVFAIGDCSSCPNSKTAAAICRYRPMGLSHRNHHVGFIAAQGSVVAANIQSVMKGKKPSQSYDGYSSCPLVTGYGTCILAEFDYSHKPLETLPIRQDKERWAVYAMHRDIMPILYWNVMLKGYWQGPHILRKIMHLNMKA